jgi:hypothetical protein
MRKPAKGIGVRIVAVVATFAFVAVFATASAEAGVGQKCPGTFRVLHNDKIDNLSVPAGNYQIKVKRMTCQSASNYFKQFLAANQNALPKGWKLYKGKKKFKNKKMNVAFKIKKVSN